MLVRFLLLSFLVDLIAVAKSQSFNSTDAHRTDYGDADVADPTDFPFYALERNSTSNKTLGCTGILIHPDVLLIARFCLSSFESNETDVLLFGKKEEEDDNELIVNVESTLSPFSFSRVIPAHLLPEQIDLDLALVKIATTTSSVPVAKLPVAAVEKGNAVYKIGFGHGNFQDLPPYDQFLQQKFLISGVGRENCQSAGSDKYFCVDIAENGTTDSCVNDSGGAVVDGNGTLIGMSAGTGSGGDDCNALWVDVHHFEYLIEPGICHLSESKPSDCDPYFFGSVPSVAPSSLSSLAPSSLSSSLAPSATSPETTSSGGATTLFNTYPTSAAVLLFLLTVSFLHL